MKGAFILPGLCDSHIHVDWSGSVSTFAQLFECTTMDEVVEKLAACPLQQSGWRMGYGVQMDSLSGKSSEGVADSESPPCKLTREILDAAFPSTPVSIRSIERTSSCS